MTVNQYVRIVFFLCLFAGMFASFTQAQEPAPQPPPAAPPTTGPRPADAEALPAVPAPVDPDGFKVGVEDILNILVWREPQLSTAVMVRPDGKITLPLVGDLVATGLTTNQLSDSIANAYSKFLTKPQVTVSVREVRSKKYWISGNIGRSGSVPLVMPTTVLQAITNAGGLGQFAKGKKIIIMRGSERLKFNYNEVIQGKNMQQNITLQDGDHILVP